MAESSGTDRRYPVGAEVHETGGVHFRVWAPKRARVEVVMTPATDPSRRLAVALDEEGDGYFAGLVESARPGTRYGFRLDGGGALFPDPASRFQPEGPHGLSCVVDPLGFPWTDRAWTGVTRDGQVLYEMHVGTFTSEGTWDAARRQLPELRSLGITTIEVMPVADFPGGFGWGYDGVALFAPTRLYGRPEDFRRFIDEAHASGLGVILDVVYNHLGPDGNYLKEFSDYYFTDRYKNEWGEAINFDGAHSRPVRDFFVTNARYWIDEYHLDGLRLDATQSIMDSSTVHVLAEISREARSAAPLRTLLIVAENEPQDVRMIRPVEAGGYGADIVWNDDFHHTVMVALTGRREAYYQDYSGSPQELISAAKHGYLYQGQYYSWQRKRRGTPAHGVSPATFVHYLQNHDQIANSARGARVHLLTSPGRWRAMTALFLLSPQTPLIFQGQEFGASSPFLYFADQRAELASKVREGRAQFLSQFSSLARSEVRAALADPGNRATFEQCKLDLREREGHAATYRLHRDLLSLRRAERSLHDNGDSILDGAVLGDEAFVLRFFRTDDDDRLLIVNLGRDLTLESAAEPFLAPPAGARWRQQWSSEDLCYGGAGNPPVESEEGCWRLPAETAVLLRASPLDREAPHE